MQTRTWGHEVADREARPACGGAAHLRVDKHKVPENEIPDALRRIQSVRFYREDQDAKCVDEFFWGGKVRLSREFDKALLELTSAIGKRLEELGIPNQPNGKSEPPAYNLVQAMGELYLWLSLPAT